MVIGGIVVFVIILIVILISSVQNKHQRSEMPLKLLYTLLIGIFVAVFIGVGIAAFYPELKYPEPPNSIKYGYSEPEKNEKMSEETKAEIEKYEQEQKTFQINSQVYNRNVSILALIFSIILVIISLTLFKKIYLIADGLLLGGVLTLLYSVIRGFESDSNMFRFIVVSVGLVISLFLGYVKFIAPTAKKE